MNVAKLPQRDRETNVLLTCAGRRNYLITFFQEALGDRGAVFAGDQDATAPALAAARRAFVLPAVDHPRYVETLAAICRDSCVRLLIPLSDLELPILAAHADRFRDAGTLPIVSSPAVIATCFDKWTTAQFLGARGVGVPRTYGSLADAQEGLRRGEVTFPLVVKPRWGSASIGVEYAENDAELPLAYAWARARIARSFLARASAAEPDRCVLVQERVSGTEYGLDIVNDLAGRHVCTLVKRKLGMRAGETDRAVTVECGELERLGASIGAHLRHIGNLDCDVFLSDAGYRVVDLNPRFGGGYPFSHAAGANLPAALVAWARDDEPDPRWLKVRPNVTASKCDTLVVVEARS